MMKRCRVCAEEYEPTLAQAKRWNWICPRCKAEKEAVYRAQREGRPALTREVLAERFWEKVDKRGPDECWPWLGAVNSHGYAEIWDGTRSRKASQVSWELHNDADFPQDLLACHSCDNRPCVNPGHIWPGTVADNGQDASRKGRLFNRNRGITHCKRGHELAGDNVRQITNRGRPGRQCKTCERIRAAARYRAQQEATQ